MKAVGFGKYLELRQEQLSCQIDSAIYKRLGFTWSLHNQNDCRAVR